MIMIAKINVTEKITLVGIEVLVDNSESNRVPIVEYPIF
jgi:hypothetical protein